MPTPFVSQNQNPTKRQKTERGEDREDIFPVRAGTRAGSTFARYSESRNKACGRNTRHVSNEVFHVALRGRHTEIARNINLLSTKSFE